jgi:3-deoxy-manno-octulosonate cytidylyltransferase (CMP-KDO synthetase)
MTTAVFIPARLNSQRLPEKMLCSIGDQPLIAHTVDRAKESGIQNVFLATDSESISEAVKDKGVQSILTSSSNQSGSDRIYEALTKVDPEAKQFDYIINLQGDLPFIDPKMISYLKLKAESSSADIITLIAPITDPKKITNPNFVKVAISFYDQACNSGRALYFSRQSIPHNAALYYEHIGIYAYKRQALKKFVEAPQTQLERQESLEQLRAYSLGLNIEVHLVDTPPISVDTLADLEEVRSKHVCVAH